MAILVAAIGLVGLLCLADLLLTFGVIRRLRERTEQLAAFAARTLRSAVSPTVRPRTLAALTAAGSGSTAAWLRVVTFFAAGCSACPARPGFP